MLSKNSTVIVKTSTDWKNIFAMHRTHKYTQYMKNSCKSTGKQFKEKMSKLEEQSFHKDNKHRKRCSFLLVTQKM